VTFDSIGIVGGGAWGTALAQTLRLAGRDVLLWAREAEVVAEIDSSHANTAFLPGVALDPARSTGTAIGKRFEHGCGLEVLCTKAGDGTLSVDGEIIGSKDSKPLPSSD